MFRRGPAIVLSLVLSAAALVVAPSAMASDGGTAKDTDPCGQGSKVRLRVDTYGDDRVQATGIVFSDDGNMWDWRFRHNDDISYKGEAKADGDGEGRSFTIVRTMVDLGGSDFIAFRAENQKTGEVCRAELTY
jgi:hypothetical protein